MCGREGSAVQQVVYPLIDRDFIYTPPPSVSLAKRGSIFVQQDLLLMDSVQQIIVEPSAAMNSGGPNGLAQKTTLAFLPSRTDIIAAEIEFMRKP